MTYDELLISCDDIIKVKETNFNKVDFLKGFKGLYKNGKIVIDSNLKQDSEKKCVLAEEIGHHFTTSGNILDDTDIRNIKQEKRARNWSYEKEIKLTCIIAAYNAGIKNRYEMAEYLHVTEVFLESAIKHYREKYGYFIELDDYIIYFEPNLGVMKRF